MLRQLGRIIVALLVLVMSIAGALAIEFVPQGNINMYGRNITNATKICIGADCRVAWPTGSGGGGGISSISSLDNFLTVVNGSSATVAANLTSFNIYNDTLFCSAAVAANGNWSADKSSYNTITQANNKYLQNQTCIGGYVMQNGTTSGAQCVALPVLVVYNNGTSNVTQLITGNGYLIVNSNSTSFNVTANISAFYAQFLNLTDQRYNETQRITDLNTSLTSNDSAQLTLINARALPATCGAGTAVQNTTTSGVQCVTLPTDTNSGGLSNVTQLITGSNYLVVVSNSTTFNVTLNYTAVNTAFNDSAAAAAKASPGNCPSGQMVQNTTTSGVQCIAPAGGGTVTQVNTDGTTTGGPITGSGTVGVNLTWINIGFYNKSYTLPDSNISSAATWNGKSTAANCAAGTVVQNTTTGGVQCLTMTVDTNSGGISNVTQLITGNNYLIVASNSTGFNITANITALNTAYNDTALANSKAAPANCAAGTVVQNTTTAGVQCVSVAAGTGDVTDVLATDASIIVANSAGPQPSVSVNSTWINTGFYNKSYALPDSNISSAATWNAKAATGTSTPDCTYGVKAVTTNSGGVPTTTCATQQGTVTSVGGDNTLTGVPFTTSGTLGVNQTWANTQFFNETYALSDGNISGAATWNGKAATGSSTACGAGTYVTVVTTNSGGVPTTTCTAQTVYLSNGSDANFGTLNVTTKLNAASTNLTTLQIAENTNLYYTDARAAAAVQNTTIARTGTCAAGQYMNGSNTSGVMCGAIAVPYQSSAAGFTNTTVLTSTALNVSIGNGASAPYPLVVNAGAGQTIALFNGSANNWQEINVWNTNTGNLSSADIVATAAGGNSTNGFVNIGINGRNYTAAGAGILSGAWNSYIYTNGNTSLPGNLIIGTQQAANLSFFTGGVATTNERLRITSTGNVGIGTTTPSVPLEVNGNITAGNVTVSGTIKTATSTVTGSETVAGNESVNGILNASSIKIGVQSVGMVLVRNITFTNSNASQYIIAQGDVSTSCNTYHICVNIYQNGSTAQGTLGLRVNDISSGSYKNNRVQYSTNANTNTDTSFGFHAVSSGTNDFFGCFDIPRVKNPQGDLLAAGGIASSDQEFWWGGRVAASSDLTNASLGLYNLTAQMNGNLTGTAEAYCYRNQ